MKIKNFVFQPVTNNVIDVHFGDAGWNSKEWVRLARVSGAWTHRKNGQENVASDEVVYGKVRVLSDVFAEIIGVCNDRYK
jgi:hypothetical protein